MSIEKQETLPAGEGISLKCWGWALALVAPIWVLIIGVIVWVYR